MALPDVLVLGCVSVLFLIAGCASTGHEMGEHDAEEDFAQEWMAAMDARPPEEQVPNWAETRELMMREAPRIGDAAPDFALETRDGSEVIQLAQFEGKMPVVLIFGSWT